MSLGTIILIILVIALLGGFSGIGGGPFYGTGEIGAEVHKLDQFFRVEEGTGEAVLDGVRTTIRAGFAVLVPINTGSAPLKLYTLYAPPNHRDGVVHHTRADAEADTEHFDGKTTE